MSSRKKSENKKSSIKKAIILVLIFAAITGLIIFELDYFDVIDLNYQPKYIGLSDDQLGSCKKLEGRTALVTIFASDKAGKWDFSQEDCIRKRRELLDQTEIVADWFTVQGKRYGKELEFRYAADENDHLLYYEHDFGNIRLSDGAGKKIRTCKAYDEWDFIEKNIDSEAIRKELGCENIAYYFFMNYDETNEGSAFQLQVKTLPNEKPYEMIWVPYQKKEKRSDPIYIAHETLHLFGAVDFYGAEKGNNVFFVPESFVDLAAKKYRTDIMYITGGIPDRTRVYDGIDGEITEMTAYYLGWIENAPSEVDWYRMHRSQFDKKK